MKEKAVELIQRERERERERKRELKINMYFDMTLTKFAERV